MVAKLHLLDELINVKLFFEAIFLTIFAVMKMNKFFLVILFFNSLHSFSQSTLQKDSVKYVQLTGIVINDSLQRLPFTAVYDKTTQRGVICDYFGYFALVVHPGDTLQFSFIGFKKKTFVVPMPDSTNSLSIVSLLESDTIMSEAVAVYPWPSREQFADAFINLEIDNDAINRAKKDYHLKRWLLFMGPWDQTPVFLIKLKLSNI